MPATSPDEALRASEQRFRQFADTVDHVFWVLELEPKEHVSYVSPAFERIWGRAAQEIYADPGLWMQAIHPDDRPAVERAFGAWLAETDHRAYEVEYRIHRTDGEMRWIKDRGRAVRDADGRLLQVSGVAEDISLRKAAERRAGDREREFRALVEGLPLLVWTCDAEGRCDYLGPQWGRFTGLPESQLLGTGWVALLHPDDREPVLAAWRRTVHEGAPYDAEMRVRGQDGGYRWFKSTAAPLRDDGGDVARWFGTCTDIQELKETAAALREGRDRLARICEVAPAVLCTLRLAPDGRPSFSFGAERVAVLYDQDAALLATDASGVMAAMHPDDAPGVWQAIDVSARDMTPFHAVFRMRRPRIGDIWVEIDSSPVREADGAISWHGVVSDVTSRKAIEQRLEAKRAQLRATFEYLGEGVAIVDLEGVPQSANRVMLELHGYAGLDDFLRRRHEMAETFEMHTLAGEAVPFHDGPLSRVLRGEPLSQLELRLRHRVQGWERIYSYGGELVRGADGTPQFAVFQVSDISDRKRVEQEIRELNAALEERVHERTRALEQAVKEHEAFSYSVSHDLRAPLRAMDGFSQAVLHDHGSLLPESGQRYLRIIRESAQKMGQLIDDLLAFSRVSRQQPNKRPVDHTLLVRSALQQLAPLQQGRQIELHIGDLPPGRGDPAMLQQVWINLLSNALKYSRNRTPAIVEVGALADAGVPSYFVRDNGAGFDMRYAHKLFGVFERLHRAEDYEGTGVGLAIVQRVVQRHGGSVRAESAPGRGATFYFTLEPGTE